MASVSFPTSRQLSNLILPLSEPVMLRRNIENQILPSLQQNIRLDGSRKFDSLARIGNLGSHNGRTDTLLRINVTRLTRAKEPITFSGTDCQGPKRARLFRRRCKIQLSIRPSNNTSGALNEASLFCDSRDGILEFYEAGSGPSGIIDLDTQFDIEARKLLVVVNEREKKWTHTMAAVYELTLTLHFLDPAHLEEFISLVFKEGIFKPSPQEHAVFETTIKSSLSSAPASTPLRYKRRNEIRATDYNIGTSLQWFGHSTPLRLPRSVQPRPSRVEFIFGAAEMPVWVTTEIQCPICGFQNASSISALQKHLKQVHQTFKFEARHLLRDGKAVVRFLVDGASATRNDSPSDSDYDSGDRRNKEFYFIRVTPKTNGVHTHSLLASTTNGTTNATASTTQRKPLRHIAPLEGHLVVDSRGMSVETNHSPSVSLQSRRVTKPWLQGGLKMSSSTKSRNFSMAKDESTVRNLAFHATISPTKLLSWVEKPTTLESKQSSQLHPAISKEDINRVEQDVARHAEERASVLANRRKYKIPRVAKGVILYRSLTKRPLVMGEEVMNSDDDIDDSWLRLRQEEMIDNTDATPIEKKFMKRWDNHFVNEEELCGKYLVAALERFTIINACWLRTEEMMSIFVRKLISWCREQILTYTQMAKCIELAKMSQISMAIRHNEQSLPQFERHKATCSCGHIIQLAQMSELVCCNNLHCKQPDYHMGCVGLTVRPVTWTCTRCLQPGIAVRERIRSSNLPPAVSGTEE